MEGGIKTCDLRNLRRRLGDCPDRREVVRLMQRSQRDKVRQRSQNIVVQPYRRAVHGAAVHDAVAYPDDPSIPDEPTACREDCAGRGRVTEVFGRPSLVSDGVTLGVLYAKMRSDPQPVHLTPKQ